MQQSSPRTRTHTGVKPNDCNQYKKAFVHNSHLIKHEEHILEGNFMNVTNVVKFLLFRIVFKVMKEYILDRKTMSLFNMVELLYICIIIIMTLYWRPTL